MQTNKILRILVTTGIFVIPFIPLYISTVMFFPFITGKNFAFRILIEIIFGLWLILALRDKAYRPKFSKVSLAVFVFLVVLGIADFFSENPYKSFWSNFERMEGYITLLHLGAYALVLGTVLNTEKLWTWFFKVSIGVSVIESIYGMFQLAGKIVINQGGVRLDGTFGNASYFATYMLFHVFLTAFLLFRERKIEWTRYVYGLIIFLQLFTLYKTETRGAILGLFGGLLIFALIFIFRERERKGLRKLAVGIFIGLILFGGGIYSLKNTAFVKNSSALTRLTSISIKDAGPRFQVWSMAWQGFKERPILGWGQESFNFVFNKYYSPQMWEQEQWFDRAHNVFFDWLIAGGILGLVSYLSMFLFTLYSVWKPAGEEYSFKHFIKNTFFFWKNKKTVVSLPEKALLTGLLSAYFFQNIFVFDNITSYLLFFSVIAYAHHLHGVPIKKLEKVVNEIDPGVRDRILFPLIIVVLFFVLYVANWKPIQSSKTLIYALRPQAEGITKNIEYLKQAVSYDTFGTTEIREQIAQAATNSIAQKEIPISIKEDLFMFGRSELLKQIERVPNDARSQLFLGSFLDRYQQYEESRIYLGNALKLSPKKQPIYFEIGSTYLNQNQYDKALEYFKAALDLEPKNYEARVIYAVGAIYAGKNDLAQSLIEPYKDTSLFWEDRLVRAYGDTKQYKKLVTIFQKKVASNPNNANFHVSLASVYVQVGDRTNAILEIRKAIELNPNFKEQGEKLLQEL